MKPGLLSLTLAAGLLSACDGASPQTGVTALMRASNAQFVPGALVADTAATGATLSGINIINTNVYPGQENFSFSGTVTGPTALVGLDGDAGHWILPATIADPTTAGGFDFSSTLSFSPLLSVGAHKLVVRGVGTDGVVGPAQIFVLTANQAPPPAGALVITLSWDTQADLDLHVLMPNADDPTTPIEIWSKHPVGLPLPALGTAPPTADQIAAAGTLDFDSNANCVIDGRRQENVVFPQAPPPGDYTVRVDAFSLCGQPDAQWVVTATAADAGEIALAQWEAIDADTRGSHAAGAGRLAFTFTVASP